MAKEIERKWIIFGIPTEIPKVRETIITSMYVSDLMELRLSRKVNVDNGNIECKMTYKSGSGLSRDEYEVKIPEELFEKALQDIKNHDLTPIKKHHYLFNDRGYPLECSIVINGNDVDFMYAEVEFDSEEAASKYTLPEGMKSAEEVTGNPHWSMRNYWNRTRKSC